MIIGCKNVDSVKLVNLMNDREAYIDYCVSLVPEDFRHIQAICNNQIYYCTLVLRKSSLGDFNTKKAFIDSVLFDIRIVGYTDDVIECNTLWGLTNKKRIEKYRRRAL